MKSNTPLLGISQNILALRGFIEKASQSNINVLIQGETGVGKELAARLIHMNSARANKPFIKLNSANLNENLLESELFGHKKGAFTGAIYEKPGLIEEADKGTFFMDEIGELGKPLQSKLLSVIEDKELRGVGQTKSISIDVRFIFASNKELYRELNMGNFRQDLYYRISILNFYILPLRNRKEDIPIILDDVLEKLNRETEIKKKISKMAIKKLVNYSFLGNVRELESVLKRAYIFAEGECINKEDIHFENDNGYTLRNCGETDLYDRMVKRGESFWDVIYKPFMARNLKRTEVHRIIDMGMREVGWIYKKLLPLFNINNAEKEYKRFMKIIKSHGLYDKNNHNYKD